MFLRDYDHDTQGTEVGFGGCELVYIPGGIVFITLLLMIFLKISLFWLQFYCVNSKMRS